MIGQADRLRAALPGAMRPQPARARLRLPARQARPLPGPGAGPARRRAPLCRSTSAAAGGRAAPHPATEPGLTASRPPGHRVHLGRGPAPRRRSRRLTYWLYRPGRPGSESIASPDPRDHRRVRPSAQPRGRSRRWSLSRRSLAGTTTASRRARNLPGAGRSSDDRAVAPPTRAGMRDSRFAWKAAAPSLALSSPHLLRERPGTVPLGITHGRSMQDCIVNVRRSPV